MTKFSAAPSNDPMSAVEAFRAAMIAGDAEGIADVHVEGDVAIIDTVAPFIWKGPTAVADWMLSMTLYLEEHDIGEGSVVYYSPIAKLADGDRAYAVVPAVWSYKSKDVPMHHAATITFALHCTPAGWKIAGWSWNRSEWRDSVIKLQPPETFKHSVGLYS
jgi:ketosteroid isomerase-like protein